MTSARTRERLIKTLRAQGIGNEAVLERMRQVPRHLFVDEALASRAYENTVLPIGFGQTISQPYIVALMTQALIEDRELPLPKVLEIGTGCGYQTAVLAAFARHIYGIERINALIRPSRQRLRTLRINNVSLRHADGFEGWASQAPFDGILVAAAPTEVPKSLLAQLDEGGRLLIPVGPSGRQSLVRITRQGDDFKTESLSAVSFVPLIAGKTQ
ncbi:MAG TPA: protein-L-isoaspartate(D-aspartate) O-methyltransferase [Gammaproteobacteria bacterium]|nr:protein-L-isoaspartate(D-aspartate) O-methyltransferase [Gammaproteobacteria bacterium]